MMIINNNDYYRFVIPVSNDYILDNMRALTSKGQPLPPVVFGGICNSFYCYFFKLLEIIFYKH